jgi:hypothetical protein
MIATLGFLISMANDPKMIRKVSQSKLKALSIQVSASLELWGSLYENEYRERLNGAS